MAEQTYKRAGVDIDAGDTLVQRIKSAVKATHGPEVMGPYGGFGALFSLAPLGLDKSCLVAATDGVGTKLLLTKETGYWGRIGQDLVAMCANDILCLGAQPLFFLDYYATGHLEVDKAEMVIAGIAEACQSIGCALIGGETAEMPGVYQPGDFDMAGFIVGWVREREIIDGSAIRAGDKVIGLASSGFHSNGYSLIRQIIQDQKLDLEDVVTGTQDRLGDLLTRPTILYGPMMDTLMAAGTCHGIAHITGGGLIGNIPRILPASCRVRLDRSRWTRPAVMDFFQNVGGIADGEMSRVFNDGIGLVVIVAQDQSQTTLTQLEEFGIDAWEIGQVEPRQDDHAAVEIL